MLERAAEKSYEVFLLTKQEADMIRATLKAYMENEEGQNENSW